MGSKGLHLCLALNVVMLTSRQRTAPMTNPLPSPHPSTGHCWVHRPTLTYQGKSVSPSSPYMGKSLRPSGSRGQRLILPCVAAKDRRPLPQTTLSRSPWRIAGWLSRQQVSLCHFSCYRRHLVYASYSNFPSQISLVVLIACPLLSV